jgi:hypothetical protein
MGLFKGIGGEEGKKEQRKTKANDKDGRELTSSIDPNYKLFSLLYFHLQG